MAGPIAWLAWARFGPGGDPAEFPLEPSPYLRKVVEPITVRLAMSFSDGGSLGLAFEDAVGTTRLACLESTCWGSWPGEPCDDVLFGTFYPREGKDTQRVPTAGVEECALLGLLQRWCRDDPVAREIDFRCTRGPKPLDRDRILEGLPPDEGTKLYAVALLRRLRRRNLGRSD